MGSTQDAPDVTWADYKLQHTDPCGDLPWVTDKAIEDEAGWELCLPPGTGSI